MKIEYLENVCDILDSQRVPITASERTSGNYPYYGANGIQDYVNDYIFDDELVLLAEDGGNFGSKTRPIAYRVSGKCWVNNHAHVLKPKDCINVDYLCYALMFYNTAGIVNGATRQKLTQASMRKMKIPLVDMCEQIKIVEKLNNLVNLKENINNQIKKYDDLVKSQFIEMFGTLEDGKFPIKTIEELCVFVKDGTHQTPTYTDDKINGYKFLSSKDVTSGYINWNNIKYIPEDLHNELYSRIKPQRNDILLAKNGTTGIGAIVETDEIFDIYVSLALLRFYSDNNVKYMWCAINMPDTKKQFNESLKGVGVPNLHLGEIKKTKLLVPPIELQNQFADFVKHIDKLKFTLKQTLEKLENCYHSLMQEYFE